MSLPVYYSRAWSPIGSLGIFATDKGVCGLSFRDKGFEELFRRFARVLGRPPCPDPERLRGAEDELARFLQGLTITIHVGLDLVGLTPFQRSVLRVLEEIPYGEVRTYQWVAMRLNNPRACRAVGAACSVNPVPILIPCHRVISKNGSLGGYSSGAGIKKWLLDFEHARTENHGHLRG